MLMAFFRKKEVRKHADGEIHLEKIKKDDDTPKRWTKVHQLLHDNRGLRYFFASIGIILAVGFGLLAMLASYEDPVIYDLPIVTKKKPEAKFYSPLTGEEVADEASTKRATTAIIIENSPDARPQSGLKDAGVVYEAVAEGGITRFLSIYQQSQPELIGPVRSLRPYYVDWLAPYDASVAHVGGSYNALQEIRNGQYKDIDQFFNADTYWRAKDRDAPHNVYTNFEKLNSLNAAKGYTESKFTGFTRTPLTTEKKGKKEKATAPAVTPASAIQVNISGDLYNSSYTYDATNKVYNRSQAGEPHTDREKGQITPKVIIVIKVPTQLGFEDGYREQMQTSGTGEGYIFQNGTVQQMTWQKADKKSQLKFLDSENKEISLARGQTWITAIATDKGVAWQ